MWLLFSGPGCVSNFMVLCVFGREKDASSTAEEGGTETLSAQKKMEEQPLAKRAVILFICFFGLQASYLTWGLLQERIMTHEYGKTANTPGEYFKNSQFLVFVNRILAFVIALLVIVFQHQPNHTAPLYKYSFSSFSNIMSSWFQYEALKFVSFPTQVGDTTVIIRHMSMTLWLLYMLYSSPYHLNKLYLVSLQVIKMRTANNVHNHWL